MIYWLQATPFSCNRVRPILNPKSWTAAEKKIWMPCNKKASIWAMPNTAPSRADPVVVFPLSWWCPPQETSQPHLPQELLCRQGGKSWKDEQTDSGRTKYKLQPTHQFQGFRHDKDFVSWCPSSQQVNDQWLCMTTFDVMWLNHKMKIVYHTKQSDKTLNQTGRTRFKTDLIKRKCRNKFL